ncbi:fusaric acid cluster transcription factor FUB10 [Colletotrichum liriopes]|uniref:Fusaric acid cluster transcription factor FUB10 n=1 Tax=Colletotrichum liriopes TaxID=708192 RepID=A0AA37M0X3_9PEZI|nr:fusaric acid cluster transcription factor FUB10 [Colletotrichum liriopes]
MQQNQQRALATRSACDRCRDQKLRCLRSQGQGDGVCVRCARAGVCCVTGAPRPLGRSRTGVNDSHKQQQGLRRPRHSVFVSVTVPQSAPRVSSSASVPGLEPDKTATEIAQELVASPPARDSDSSFGCFHEPLAADSNELSSMLLDEGVSGSDMTPDDAVIDALDLAFPDNPTALSDLVGGPNTEEFFMELEADLDELFGGGQPASKSLSALSGTDNPSFCVDTAFLRQSLPGSALEITNRLPPEPSLGPNGNTLVRLARINECIAHQLSHMGTFVIGIPPPNLVNSCVEGAADLQVNPILRAIESTSELAAIIREIITPVQDHGSSSSLNIPVVLMCLSSHIQLLQIYNSIFFHVHRFLGSLHDTIGFFENLPGFTHISGLPPMKGDLYIQIIIQVTQHNISSVERGLGLSADLCLSRQRTFSRGLLSYVDSLEPFQSIMGQSCNPSEKSGQALVTSLRIQIRNVLGILRDTS